MPAPYASLGIIGGLFLLGVLVYNIWTQGTPNFEEKPHDNCNFGPGYDRPRNDDWGNDDNEESRRRRRRRDRVESCVICRESFEGTSSTKKLPCGHTFHDNCIMLWFRENKSCPNCRRAFD